MCGIAGLFGFRNEVLEHRLHAMGAAMKMRGPDDSGTYIEPSAGFGMVHRRLSILDLSSAGHQPMRSSCGRYLLILNGEIYNFKELRHLIQIEASDIRWKSSSDTEVLVEAIALWGIDKTLSLLVGMFAFAIWDVELKQITLARDRFGEKPLYYGWAGNGIAFGSTLKSIKSVSEFLPIINRNALSLFMRHNCVPAPLSIYEGIYKLPSGSYVSISEEALRVKCLPKIKEYWSLREISNNLIKEKIIIDDSDAIEVFEKKLIRSVVGQMQSDVPLGAFLSGGVDSSVIVSLMQNESLKRGNGPINTFTIGVPDVAHNEAERARLIAEHLGTNHSELYIKPDDALLVVKDIPDIYDEPFADSSQIPTLLLCRMTREKCAVALSGDGGDELLGGYSRYKFFENVQGNIKRYPALVSILSAAINFLPVNAWNEIYKLGRNGASDFLLGDKLYKFDRLLAARTQRELYIKLISHWDPNDVVLSCDETNTEYDHPWSNEISYRSNMMVLDGLTYLPNDIMTKVDRASMSVSLESRAPYLDHRLHEYLWQLPANFKSRDGVDKWILKQLLYKYVPKKLVDQPKRGFTVPIGAWLRGPLRDWADALLSRERLKRDGYLNPEIVIHKWKEHISGERNWQYLLWDVLMFQAWLEVQ